MRLFQNLRRSVELLKPWKGYYAVCGGIAACLYRETPRYTGDIDIALIDTPDKSAKDIAFNVIESLGYQPQLGYVTDQNGLLLQTAALVIGREETNTQFVGVDFLLPVLSWVQDAVKRAQLNVLDYGFANVASITPEDLIAAKLFAIQGTPNRKYDLDDVLSILANLKEINLTLLKQLIHAYELKIPEEVQKALDRR